MCVPPLYSFTPMCAGLSHIIPIKYTVACACSKLGTATEVLPPLSIVCLLMDSVLPPVQVTQPPRGEQQSQLLGGFDEKAYLATKQLKPGDDPYREHAFNLQESDRLGSERAIRDTRHYRWVSERLTFDHHHLWCSSDESESDDKSDSFFFFRWLCRLCES